MWTFFITGFFHSMAFLSLFNIVACYQKFLFIVE